MNKVRSALASFLLATSLSVYAESDVRTAYPLAFQDAIRLALANRLEGAIERTNIQSAEAHIEEAKGAYLPSLDVFSTLQRVKAYDDFSGVAVTATYAGVDIPVEVKKVTPGYQISGGLELTQNLYSGGARGARLDASRVAKLIAESTQALTRKKIVLDVVNAYWAFRKAQIACAASQRNLEFARKEVAVAAVQFQEGHISRIEVDAKTLMAETREIELRGAMRLQRDRQRRYLYVLGLDPDVQIAEQPRLNDEPSRIDADKVLASVGLMREPEIIKAQREFDEANARVREARADFEPKVDFFLRYSGIGRGNQNFGDAETDFGKESAVVGVRLKWNWFNGFQTASRVEQADLSAQQARLHIDLVQREIANELREKRSEEEDKSDQLLLARRQLELSRTQFLIAKKRRETDLISESQYDTTRLATEEANDKMADAEINLLVVSISRRLLDHD